MVDRPGFTKAAAPDFSFFGLFVASTHVFLLAVAG
jgi:hypothetical protein